MKIDIKKYHDWKFVCLPGCEPCSKNKANAIMVLSYQSWFTHRKEDVENWDKIRFPRREKISLPYNIRYSKDGIEGIETFHAEVVGPSLWDRQDQAVQEFLNSRCVDWAKCE